MRRRGVPPASGPIHVSLSTGHAPSLSSAGRQHDFGQLALENERCHAVREIRAQFLGQRELSPLQRRGHDEKVRRWNGVKFPDFQILFRVKEKGSYNRRDLKHFKYKTLIRYITIRRYIFIFNQNSIREEINVSIFRLIHEEAPSKSSFFLYSSGRNIRVLFERKIILSVTG